MSKQSPKLDIQDDRITMPAGVYYLGDPCYAFHDGWHDVLYGLWATGHDAYIYKGFPILMFGTAYGDGCYGGSDGRTYGVDAGLIGLVHESLIEDTSCWTLGSKFVSTESFVCTRSEGGCLTFGEIIIDTGDDAFEEEDQDDEGDDE